MIEALQANFPGADLEVKIVLPIMLRARLLNTSFRCARILRCESLKRLQNGNQAAHHEISPNVFNVHPYLLTTQDPRNGDARWGVPSSPIGCYWFMSCLASSCLANPSR